MLIFNDLLAFVLEILSLVLLAKWAHSIPENNIIKIVFAIVVVLIFGFIWGVFFSPKANYPLTGITRWVLEYIILLFPYFQFIRRNPFFILLGGVIIFVNLFIQSSFGRAEWWGNINGIILCHFFIF